VSKFIVGCLVFFLSVVSYAQTVQSLPERASNIRSGPSTEYSVRAGFWSPVQLSVTGKSVLEGETACVEDDNYNNDLWLRVDIQGIEGWVNFCVVRFDGDLDTLPVVEPAYPELDEWINQATVPLDGIFFSVIRDELGEAPDTPYVIASTRTQNFIHLRENPDLGANILDHLSGEQVYVTGVSADGVWLQVEYDAKLSSCYADAESVDDCPLERVTGWVARYLLSLPQDWQDIFAEDES